jgi:hypothetical protein
MQDMLAQLEKLRRDAESDPKLGNRPEEAGVVLPASGT